MKLHQLISLNAILALGFGIAFALYGPIMIAMFGVPEIPEGNVLLYWNIASFARMFGAALFGLGILLWAIRGVVGNKNVTAETRRGIVFALLIANGMGLFVSLTQQMAIWLKPAGWITVGTFAALVLAYAYFLVARSDPSEYHETSVSNE